MGGQNESLVNIMHTQGGEGNRRMGKAQHPKTNKTKIKGGRVGGAEVKQAVPQARLDDDTIPNSERGSISSKLFLAYIGEG